MRLRTYVIPFAILFLALAPLQAGTAGKVKAGNRSFKKGEYEKALNRYREAEITAPNSPVVHFNLGDALYKTDDLDGSVGEFQRSAAAQDRTVRSRAYYNLGNTAFRQEKYDDAVAHYKKALELNPHDIDAKYNLEYALRRKMNPPQNKNDRKKNDKRNGPQKQQQQQAGRGQDDKDKNTGARDRQNSMSKEDAERILNVFNEQDRDSAKKRRAVLPQIPKTEEDW
jgi:Ca-activated chloride channel family protein